jgi:hypothetical protein
MSRLQVPTSGSSLFLADKVARPADNGSATLRGLRAAAPGQLERTLAEPKSESCPKGRGDGPRAGH